MTIDEAIQNLTDTLKDYKRTYHEDDANALKLAIEALKFLVTCKLDCPLYIKNPLPGETKD